MIEPSQSENDPEMLEEYDFSGGVRGKYVSRFAEDVLSHREKLLLADCEKTIEAGLKVFYEVGRALLTIRDLKLYRESHTTFEQYCKERWHISRQHAYRQIWCWDTYQTIQRSDLAPAPERQLRELRKLPREKWVEGWETATKIATDSGSEITVNHVEQAVQRFLGQPRRTQIKKISLRICHVCNYHFSDEHHIKPRSSGGRRFGTVSLCPNHHRFATLVQQMLDGDHQRNEIEEFANQHFDSDFNRKLLNKLLNDNYRVSGTLANSLDLLFDPQSDDSPTEDRQTETS